jgi:hypothetical protein
MLRLAAPLAGLALLAVLLGACSGGENQATSTPTAPTAEERAAAEPILRAAILSGEDMPEGFTFSEEGFLTNEESAAQGLDYTGAPTVEDLNRWGQILEYEVTYQREFPTTLTGATLSIDVTITLYRDSAGADDNFEVVRQQTSGPDYIGALEQAFAEGGRDISMSPISFANVAEDRMAFEFRYTMYAPNVERDLDFVEQLIAIRRGRAIGVIDALATGSPHPVEELEDLARKLDERLKDALE